MASKVSSLHRKSIVLNILLIQNFPFANFPQFIILFGMLAAANAGDLTHGYLGYGPTIEKSYEYAAPLAKTIEYAAPVAKTIEYAEPLHKAVFQPNPVYAKTVYEPEPYHQHHNYHASLPSVHAVQALPSVYASHESLSHYGKTIASPIVHKYDSQLLHEDPHYKVAAYPAAYPASYPTSYAAPATYAHAAPLQYNTIVKSAPIVAAAPIVKSYVHEEPHYKVAAAYPTIVKSAPVVPAPILKSYDHGYDHSYDHSYAHASPVIATKAAAVSYSPAAVVSHATFESAHSQYAW